MKIKIIIFLSLIINLCSCDKSQVSEKAIGIFDISKDDKTILFSYFKDNTSSIYSMNIDGTNIKTIIESKNGKSFYNPRYSSDNKMILFIENDVSDKENSSLCIANADGSNIIQLTNNLNIITEAFFRENNNEIIFCKANEFKNYSPIARKMPHGFDIYSINLKTKKTSQLTKLDAYSINYAKEIEGKIVFQIKSKLYNGVFALADNVHHIVPFIANGDSEDVKANSDFLFLPDKKEIIYISNYDLYKMNSITNKEEFLFTSNLGIISLMRKFNTSDKILCSIQNETNLCIIEDNKLSKSIIPINL